ncbi:universal stress protein [Klebsiella grimontii]|nr:universal stress protein [Klebsiella grimontii]
MYKNILVPVDVFEIGLADKALSHARFLAQSSAGKIHLLHVIPAFSPVLTRGFISDARKMEDYLVNTSKEGANKRGNSSRLTQSFHFFMFEPIFSPVNALNQPI